MSGFVDKTIFSYRSLNGLSFFIAASALAFTTIYLQVQLALEPCLLCTLTRLLTLAISLIFLLAFLHNPGSVGQKIYGFFSFVLILSGITASLRHIWLQTQPINLATFCDSSYEQLFATMPSIQTLMQVFQGATECTTSQWTLIGLSLAEQALLLFAALLVIVWNLLRKKHQPRGLFY
ncbi:MAG: disulfide bond formation protein B [Pontibacterium sp.]